MTHTVSTANFGTGPAAFDPKYYLAKNPDVARQLASFQGNDKFTAALRHFIDFGAKEFRNPSAQFDVKAYVTAYPDVARSGVNPLLHFRNCGRVEGRQAFPVQDGTQTLGMPHAAPASAIFDLTSPHSGPAMLGQTAPGLAFQAGPAASPPPVAGPGLWAHGSALLHLQAGSEAFGALARAASAWGLPVQPAPGAAAAILHGPGADALVPVFEGGKPTQVTSI